MIDKIDKGTPPSSYLKQLEKEKTIIEENELKHEENTTEESDELKPETETNTNNNKKIHTTTEENFIKPPRKPSIKVNLENEYIDFSFYALDVAETDLAFAFLVEEEGFNVRPKMDSKFTLSYENINYTVYYVSPPFKFPEYLNNILLLIKENSIKD